MNIVLLSNIVHWWFQYLGLFSENQVTSIFYV
jgi:hypothetical protein